MPLQDNEMSTAPALSWVPDMQNPHTKMKIFPPLSPLEVAPLLLSDLPMTLFLSLLSLLRVISVAILVLTGLFGQSQLLRAERKQLVAVASGFTRVIWPWLLRRRCRRSVDKRIDAFKACAQPLGFLTLCQRSAAHTQSFDFRDRDSLQQRCSGYSDHVSAYRGNPPGASHNDFGGVETN